MLAFTSVYFFESRLFNGLQPIQIRKTRLVLDALAGRPERAFAIPCLRGPSCASVGFADYKRIAQIPILWNMILIFLITAGAERLPCRRAMKARLALPAFPRAIRVLTADRRFPIAVHRRRQPVGSAWAISVLKVKQRDFA